MCSFTKKASAFPPDPLPGIRPWTPLGVPQTPSLLLCPPNNPVRSTPLTSYYLIQLLIEAYLQKISS